MPLRLIEIVVPDMALALSVVIGLALGEIPQNAEFAARTDPTPWAFAVALASGTAGALAFTTGLPAALVGVMVAVALLPPAVVAGVSAGAGDWTASSGALLLLAINLTCVILSAMATFWAQGVGPRTWWEADDALRKTRLALVLLLSLAALLAALLVVHSVYV